MKLALIRRAFSTVGGAELYLQRLLGALAARGHEVDLITESWPGAPANIKVRAIAATASRAQRARAFAEAAREAVSQERYDCVFSLERTLKQDVYRAGDGVHRMWVARRRQFGPWWRRIFTGRFHREMMQIEREVFNPANTGWVIVNSLMVWREIRECFGYPEDRMVLVRNGVDVKRFRSGNREAVRRQFQIAPDDFLCLFVGSGWERKGLKQVIRALEKVRARWSGPGRIKLLVVGKGKPFGRDRDVLFAGPVKNTEDFYAAADLFTFLPIYEPSANVCIEALAAGLPVITSACNGAGELIVQPGWGEVVADPSDIAAAAGAIERRAVARERIAVPDELLSLDRNVEETLAVLERAAASR